MHTSRRSTENLSSSSPYLNDTVLETVFTADNEGDHRTLRCMQTYIEELSEYCESGDVNPSPATFLGSFGSN